MTDHYSVFDYSYVGLSRGGEQAFAAPSKLLASMACGKPILASAMGDTGALVLRSRAGIVVPQGEPNLLQQALRRIAAEGPSSARALGEVALDYYRRELSAGVRIDHLESLLTGALNARAIPRPTARLSRADP